MPPRRPAWGHAVCPARVANRALPRPHPGQHHTIEHECCSGHATPYLGTLGVVREGAWADVRLVDGAPTEDLSALGDPASNLLMVMKDGTVDKQTQAVTAAHALGHVRFLPAQSPDDC